MVARLVLAAALCLVTRDAIADSATLAKARQAIEGVRYTDAQPLLVAALRQGGNSPSQMIEIYRLSASTAIVLGQPAAGEQYYRRWLAMVPNATLPDSVAPKLREPFVAAQAFMAAHGRLAATAQRTGEVIDVMVEADPLAMVAAVVLVPQAAPAGSGPVPAADDAQPRPLGTDRRARLDIAAGATAGVALLDEFGNHLLELPTTEIPVTASMVAGTPLGPTPRDATAPARLPLYRNPVVWAVPAIALGLVGLGFAVAARTADTAARDILTNPGAHFYSELTDAQDRRDRNALVANLGFVVGGACAVTALVMAVTRSTFAPPVTVTPITSGVGLVMSRGW